MEELHQQMNDAILASSLPKLKALVDQHQLLNDKQEINWNWEKRYGYCNCLLASALYRNHELVRYLIEQGAAVDFVDWHGYTPLMYANHRENVNNAQLLVDFGVNVDSTDRYQETSLIKAAERGAIAMIKFLLNEGANINATDRLGETPLMKASEFNRLEAVEYILMVGGDPFHRNENGKTALDLAKENKHYKVIALLEISMNISKY